MGKASEQTIVTKKRQLDADDQEAYAQAVNNRLRATRDGNIDPLGWIDLQRQEYLGVRPQEAANAGGGTAYFGNETTDARQNIVEALMKQAADKSAAMPTYTYGQLPPRPAPPKRRVP